MKLPKITFAELKKNRKLLLLLVLAIVVPIAVAAAYTVATFAKIFVSISKGEVTTQVLKFEHDIIAGDIDAVVASGKLIYEGDLGLNYTIVLNSDIPDDTIIAGFMPIVIAAKHLELPENIVDLLHELGVLKGTPYWFGVVLYAPGKWKSIIEQKFSELVQKLLELLYLAHPELADIVYIEDNYLVIRIGEQEIKLPLDLSKYPSCAPPESDDLCVVITPMPYPFWLPGGEYNVIAVNHVIGDYVSENKYVEIEFLVEGKPPILSPTAISS